MVMAAKAAGLAAVDAPYGDFKNQAGLERSCEIGTSLGFDGKWAIHPAQLDTINRAFSPSDEDITRAQRILQAYEEAKKRGAGAAAVDGKMVDAASIRLAHVTYERAKRLGLLPDGAE